MTNLSRDYNILIWLMIMLRIMNFFSQLSEFKKSIPPLVRSTFFFVFIYNLTIFHILFTRWLLCILCCLRKSWLLVSIQQINKSKIRVWPNKFKRLNSLNWLQHPIRVCLRHCAFHGVFWENKNKLWSILLQHEKGCD